ncbi:sensor histidine kinase, partial [Streptomyces sp. 2MCAF27]
LENAVSFSPSHTPVEVVVRPGSDVSSHGGALIEVIDHGLGMSAERLDEENARLVRRERLDLVPSKVLGLFVVGSLARRWGIRVSLSRTPGGGVTGSVWIPAALMLTVSPLDLTPTTDADAGGTVRELPARPDPLTKPERGSAAPTPLPVRTPTTAPTQPGGLPRRIPNRKGTDGQAANAPTTDTSSIDSPPSRPLRKRVRGATLATTTAPADRVIPAARRPVDAEAVRSELDEFEAAVRRAQQDSATTPTPTEPAPSHEQRPRKESGSDNADR